MTQNKKMKTKYIVITCETMLELHYEKDLDVRVFHVPGKSLLNNNNNELRIFKQKWHEIINKEFFKNCNFITLSLDLHGKHGDNLELTFQGISLNWFIQELALLPVPVCIICTSCYSIFIHRAISYLEPESIIVSFADIHKAVVSAPEFFLLIKQSILFIQCHLEAMTLGEWSYIDPLLVITKKRPNNSFSFYVDDFSIKKHPFKSNFFLDLWCKDSKNKYVKFLIEIIKTTCTSYLKEMNISDLNSSVLKALRQKAKHHSLKHKKNFIDTIKKISRMTSLPQQKKAFNILYKRYRKYVTRSPFEKLYYRIRLDKILELELLYEEENTISLRDISKMHIDLKTIFGEKYLNHKEFLEQLSSNIKTITNSKGTIITGDHLKKDPKMYISLFDKLTSKKFPGKSYSLFVKNIVSAFDRNMFVGSITLKSKLYNLLRVYFQLCFIRGKTKI